MFRLATIRNAERISLRMTRSGEGHIRGGGTGFSKKEQAQEDLWAHKRDLEHLKELQEKLKKAQEAVEKHTQTIIEKSSKK
ncbi:hypothetical protein MP638_004438 [Amoeboaphelidium occidentale]|nr:hypothetical protein MP638_004438 [Amoeboaphelidium occidentale]